MALALGFSTHLGWACVAAVDVDASPPRAVFTGRIETATAGDRQALEPYHVAGGFKGLDRHPPPPDPEAVVAEGLQRQLATTTAAIANLIEELPIAPTVAAVITARGKLAASLDKVLASHAQIHVAEGNAVRESIRQACRSLHISVVDLDGKDLQNELAASTVTQPADYPWRKEEKLCAFAAQSSGS